MQLCDKKKNKNIIQGTCIKVLRRVFVNFSCLSILKFFNDFKYPLGLASYHNETRRTFTSMKLVFLCPIFNSKFPQV